MTVNAAFGAASALAPSFAAIVICRFVSGLGYVYLHVSMYVRASAYTCVCLSVRICVHGTCRVLFCKADDVCADY